MEGSSHSSVPITISEIQAAQSPKLILEVIESSSFSAGKIIAITALGIEGSTRGKNDGKVYLGTGSQEAGKAINDLVLPQEEGLGRRHFMFRYNPSMLSYFIKDLGDGSGTFVRVKAPLILKQGYIVSFGDSHLIVQLDEDTTTKITLRFVEGPKASQTFTFTETDSPIRIGRMADCSIMFDDTSLSRYQTMMTFVEGSWRLEDGDGTKSSTNGTWLYVDDYFKVHDGMVFKAGQSLFSVRSSQCKLEWPKSS